MESTSLFLTNFPAQITDDVMQRAVEHLPGRVATRLKVDRTGRQCAFIDFDSPENTLRGKSQLEDEWSSHPDWGKVSVKLSENPTRDRSIVGANHPATLEPDQKRHKGNPAGGSNNFENPLEGNGTSWMGEVIPGSRAPFTPSVAYAAYSQQQPLMFGMPTSSPYGAGGPAAGGLGAIGGGDYPTVFIANLPADCTRRELSHVCRNLPGFINCRVSLCRSGEFQMGFVEFATAEEAALALQTLTGYVFDMDQPGEPLRAEISTSRKGR